MNLWQRESQRYQIVLNEWRHYQWLMALGLPYDAAASWSGACESFQWNWGLFN